MLDVNTVYNLCNRNSWFTYGTNSQYNRMFEMVRQGKSIHDIAVVIWICSDGSDKIGTIERILKENER